MTPQDVSTYLHFDDSFVISNACETGSKAFGGAFVDAGAKYYIAPDGYPEGDASLLYLTIFYYSYFCKNMTVEEAHFKAQNQDEETKMFQLYGK